MSTVDSIKSKIHEGSFWVLCVWGITAPFFMIYAFYLAHRSYPDNQKICTEENAFNVKFLKAYIGSLIIGGSTMLSYFLTCPRDAQKDKPHAPTYPKPIRAPKRNIPM